jgi:hypothetical protein
MARVEEESNLKALEWSALPADQRDPLLATQEALLAAQRLRVDNAKRAVNTATKLMREAQERERRAQEQARLDHVRSLKDKILQLAPQLDADIIAFRDHQREVMALIGDLYTAMTEAEKRPYIDMLSSRGIANAIGYHKLAASLGMHGVASYANQHLSYESYIRVFCARPEDVPQATPPPAEPPRDTNTYMSEADALSQVHPKGRI